MMKKELENNKELNENLDELFEELEEKMEFALYLPAKGSKSTACHYDSETGWD